MSLDSNNINIKEDYGGHGRGYGRGYSGPYGYGGGRGWWPWRGWGRGWYPYSYPYQETVYVVGNEDENKNKDNDKEKTVKQDNDNIIQKDFEKSQQMNMFIIGLLSLIIIIFAIFLVMRKH